MPPKCACAGLRIVYVPFGCVLLMVPSRWIIRRIEDDGRPENASREIEDGYLLNKGMKDDRITVTGDDL